VGLRGSSEPARRPIDRGLTDQVAHPSGASRLRKPYAWIRDVLPQGQTLPEASWRRRHRTLVALLWAHVAGLFVFGLWRGYPVTHSLTDAGAVAVPALLAVLLHRRPRIAAALVSLGLITSSAILVHLWDGVIEAHFHFFVMIVVLALYEDWLPFLLAAAYVIVHHGVFGVLDPHSVYNHKAAFEHPWRWATIHGAFVMTAGVGAVATWRLNEDIRAETHEAYRKARESEERFRSAFESAPIGMSLIGMTEATFGRFLQVNRSLCEILGRPESELLAIEFADLMHPDEREENAALMQALVAGERRSLQMERRFMRADGSVGWAHVSFSLVYDGAGKPIHGISQVEDISDRRQAQKQLAHQAYHDSLTGLPNRRKLMEDLDRHLAAATRESPLFLLLFDLDGFKAYNDTFGHPAGDALLSRLGRRLQSAVKGRGVPYRMGGDEFCVLARLRVDGEAPLARAALAALTEQGEGFEVGASYGSVVLPPDGSNASQALRKADQRLYARKGTRRTSPARQATDALLSALGERSQDLGLHLHDVTDLCEIVTGVLDLPEELATPVLQAAALHDVGKVGIPDAILQKPAALDESEWTFIRAHTVIGERILSSAPALAQAAKLVRSTHERFDGKGYPDGLAGTDIPLGARIIAVCDAYDAMTTDRPYRTAMSPEVAISELRRNAGTQFDPRVVDAFLTGLAERYPELATSRA
jgi:diguanylate cyclase (GGDEF)-like protein/PAS domain S-box-containing protein